MKSLTLRMLDKITHTSVLIAIKNMTALEGLDVSGCFNVGLIGILIQLRATNPKALKACP